MSDTALKRTWIPYLNTLHNYAIFFVVLVHCSPSAAARPALQIMLLGIPISFLMPLFVVVSGLLFYYSNLDKPITFRVLLQNKATRLLLPYWVVSTVAFFPKALLIQYSARTMEFSFSHYWHSLVYPVDNPVLILWFIPVLFILFIPAIWLMRGVRNLPLGMNLLIVALLLALYRYNPVETKLLALNRVADYLGFFYAGMLVAKYYLSLNQLKQWWVIVELASKVVYKNGQCS